MPSNYISSVKFIKFKNKDFFLLGLDFPEKPNPGQFVMLRQVDGRNDPYLPRPISVFDWENGILSLLIKVVGRGTKLLSELQEGDKLRVVGHLGNNYPDNSESLTLAGGGVGIAPLYYTAKNTKAKSITFILGFKTKDEIILEDEFKSLGKLVITTDDGSYGFKGNPATYLKDRVSNGEVPELVLTCGPEIMMQKIHEAIKDVPTKDFHSLEARMGCGIGACLGCKCDLPGGSFLVCKEGPVFEGNEIFEGNN